MTVRIDNPKFRNEYALNDLQAQIDALDFDGVENDLTALKQSVANAQSTADTALGTAQSASGLAGTAASNASMAQASANQAQSTANSAKEKTDKISIDSTVSTFQIRNVNTAYQGGITWAFSNGIRRMLWTGDDFVTLYDGNNSRTLWKINMNFMKYAAFEVKTDLRVNYLYGSMIIALAGIAVSVSGGNWIQIATLAQLHISTYQGTNPMYGAVSRGYEDGYDGTLRLDSRGLYLRGGTASGSYYWYGQIVVHAIINNASPISEDPEDASQDMFIVVG